MQPVDVVTHPAEEYDDGTRLGAAWSYECACGWQCESYMVSEAAEGEDYPPPPDPLTVLLPALRRIGLERIAAALRGAS